MKINALVTYDEWISVSATNPLNLSLTILITTSSLTMFMLPNKLLQVYKQVEIMWRQVWIVGRMKNQISQAKSASSTHASSFYFLDDLFNIIKVLNLRRFMLIVYLRWWNIVEFCVNLLRSSHFEYKGDRRVNSHHEVFCEV